MDKKHIRITKSLTDIKNSLIIKYINFNFAVTNENICCDCIDIKYII